MRLRSALVATTGAAVAVTVAVMPTGGSAQSSAGRTLALFENTAHESDAFVDNAPRSPAKDPGNRRFRLSSGDELTARTPILDHRAGNRVGTLYVEATVATGTKFQNAVLQAQTVLALGDGTIVLAGLAGRSQSPFAVLGGTGAYEGARGSATEKETNGGAELTVRLLP
jgi:hypothetical protein